ncbi:hypothetical protein Talka_00651 [Tepidimonas alkaliphilus]|uniref:SPOR domain-containing protein n=1 Tax=Tepidimonas alkaliphilus TaxID=2588942 RepID=A0A554WBN1_9BURK|nr:hypothetical protein [Tepidimonas alkaliphilus]TSE20988.1 hypothetical protein Talka_00651 [Tepidimonas alkaliphilus]
MLRALVLVLLLANAALAAWQAGWLDPWLSRHEPRREPERLAQQLEPQRLRLLNSPGAPTQPPPTQQASSPTAEGPVAADADPVDSAEAAWPLAPTAAAAGAASREPRRCWQLPALPPAQAQALRRAAETQAGLQGRHTESVSRQPSRWLVYIGPLADPAALAARRAALRQAGLDQRLVEAPGVGPGVALGTYSTEEAARKALAEAQQRGVRDARVVRERPASELLTLRWPDLTAAEIAALREALGPAARQLAACP